MHLYCPTDGEYANLANGIYSILQKELSFLDDEDIRNVSTTIALYFEDIKSGTRQFETFTKLYHEMFGYYVPFYNSKEATDESAEIDAMRFILWLSCTQEHDETLLNPCNDGNKDIAVQLWEHWLSVRDSISPNSDLADFLFCEETQTDPMKIKSVLIWLQHNSFLGRYFNNPSENYDPFGFTDIIGNVPDKTMLRYGIQSYSAFQIPSWPLSLMAQRIYAEMIRIEMDDKDDELADAINKMECSAFGIYEIIGTKYDHLIIRDFNGKEYNVNLDNYEQKSKYIKKEFTHIIGSFFRFNDEWSPNGLTSISNIKHYDKYKTEASLTYDYMNNHVGQYDEYVNAHGGNRMYFFANYKEVAEFYRKELNMDGAMHFPSHRKNEPVMLFFEPNGQFTISLDTVKLVKHPDNPYYNKNRAECDCLSLIARDSSCSPDALIYMIENGLLPDALINDIRGKEYGLQTMQNNIEFFARCLRRDINRDTPFSKRNPAYLPEKEGATKKQAKTKLGFNDFVNTINEFDSIRSSANKEWLVVSCNSADTVIRDVKGKKDFTIGTRDLYDAHLKMIEKDIKVSTLEPLVGKANAPAASALLYNVVGRGAPFAFLRNEFMKFLKTNNLDLDKLADNL